MSERGAEMDDEALAIVRNLASRDAETLYDSEYGNCALCGWVTWELSPHDPDCLWLRARRLVERLDAAAQPVHPHVRFSRTLNMGKGMRGE